MPGLNSTVYIEKKAHLTPVFQNNDKLYYQAYNALSKDSLYLLNYLNQIHKKPFSILFSDKKEFFSLLETKQELIPTFKDNTSFCIEEFLDIIQAAQDCSDIHFNPGQDSVSILFRQQGYLHLFKTIKKSDALSLFNLIKVKAQMDLTRHNIPQNGRITINLPQKTIFGRVSTLPCLHGESIVIRLHFPEINLSYDYSALDNTTFLQTFLEAKPGLWLITGPIGHGKTTTYYHLLNRLIYQQVLSLEDPIEIIQPQIIQLKLSSDISGEGYLRSLLRQNINVVGIGEIRSQQHLKLAVNLAITGHCTLATFHAGSLQDAQHRLSHFGYTLDQQNKFLKGILFQAWDCQRNLAFQENTMFASSYANP